jgi:outer membrane protein TolC
LHILERLPKRKGSTIKRIMMDLFGLKMPVARGGVLATAAMLLVTAPVMAQTIGSTQSSQPVQSAPAMGYSPQSGVSASSFQGSLVTDKPTGTVMDLSLDEAIRRGLQHNLGVILQSSQQEAAAGQRLQQLQALLPTVDAQAKISVTQLNLAAEGFQFPGINPIVGPFQVVDFRASLTWSLLNVASLENFLAARHNFEGTKLSAQDARDMVVLTVGNAYLTCVADAARVTSVGSELQTTQVSLDQANANHDAGTSPKLDVLRAQVDNQNLQQQLIVAKNQLEKDKLALARTIGLPLAQEFNLTDSAPYAPLDNIDTDQAVAQALKTRKDLQAMQEQLKGTKSQKTAAFAQQLPSAQFQGDFGDIGTTPAHSHDTYSATGIVSAPILQIAKTRGDEEVADAQYRQLEAQYSDMTQQVNADVRDAILDIQSAAKLVQATKSNVDLATEALSEAQDRFKAGISDNLATSQAETQVEQANDQYISALYQHNIAKLSLARALGIAQTNYKDYFGGKQP